MSLVSIALAQINPTVGDIPGNEKIILDAAARATEAGADIVVFPELALCGYPPEDLLFKPHFLADCRASLDRLAQGVGNITAVVGYPRADTEGGVYNAAALLTSGQITGIYDKTRLPNYGVFDEPRYFKQGSGVEVFDIAGVKTGLTICEDIWEEQRTGGGRGEGRSQADHKYQCISLSYRQRQGKIGHAAGEGSRDRGFHRLCKHDGGSG